MTNAGTPATSVFDSRPGAFPDALELHPLTTLGRPGSGLTLEESPKVERDRAGWFYVLQRAEKRPLTVCEPDGRPARTVGRFGEELHWYLTDVHVAPDGSVVLLHDHHWGSVFDREGSWTRGVQLVGHAIHQKLIGMRDGRILVAVGNPSLPPPRHKRVHAEPPLQLYDEEGRLERRFGPDDFRVPWGARRAAWAGDGSIWLWGPGYRIERCDLEGRVDRVIGVQGPEDWYTEWSPGLFMTKEEFDANEAARAARPQPPPPTRPAGPVVVQPKPLPVEVSDVAQIGDALLLVAAHVFYAGTDADPLPKLVYDPSAGSCARGTPTEVLDHRFRSRNTVLDLIEIPTGRVRARAEVRGGCHLASDGTLWRPVVRDETVQIDIFEVGLPAPGERSQRSVEGRNA